MRALPGRIAGLGGWRRHGLAFLLGAFATLALAPLYVVPVLLVSMTGLVWLLDGTARLRTAFATGWWFGFGFHVFGLYWISAALFVDGSQFAIYLPVTSTALPALMAVFSGLAAMAMVRWGGHGIARILLLAAAWGLMERLRGWFLTGFPWNMFAYGWSGHEAVLQTASVVGGYGLTLLTVLFAAAPAFAWAPATRRDRRGVPALIVTLLALGGCWGWGAWRLAQPQPADVPGVRLRLVQPSIPQSLKWDREARVSIIRQLMALSLSQGHDAVSHVIWAETAVPFPLADDPEARKVLSQVVPKDGLLLTGAPRYAWGPDDKLSQAWNGLVALDAAGEIRGSFDKFHLVPLGEYLPMRSILGRLGLSKITAGSVDFTPGPGPRTLHLPGLPAVGPLICYEVIFPGEVVDPADRPAWLLNVTNDGWYGRTAGPHQHLAIAAMRAVEEGIPLIRVANNGISAAVDAYGRVIANLELDRVGVIDTTLPSPLPGITIFALARDYVFFLLVGLTLLGAALFRRR